MRSHDKVNPTLIVHFKIYARSTITLTEPTVYRRRRRLSPGYFLGLSSTPAQAELSIVTQHQANTFHWKSQRTRVHR